MSKIIVTSSYPELSNLIRDVVKELNEEITVIEVVLEDAVEQVHELIVKEQPLVLVSRGATAELLRQSFSLPVVSLDPSEIDILEAIAKAKERSTSIGYVSYPKITDQEFLRKVFEILGVQLKHYTYRTILELSEQMEHAYLDGCETVIGGGFRGLTMARSYGMEGFLIYTSRSTVLNAMERAQEIVTLKEQKREEEERLRRANLAKGLVAHYYFRDIVGPGLKDTINRAKRFSMVDATVLILGESGTGKELFAQSIHNHSSRSSRPFVALNCANLPEHLLESELFGYEEGAFTGAKRGGKIGLFELADGGTFFLDEIDRMSANLQASLLRVLQTKELRRVGGGRMIPLDVRVIAASNRDLKACMEDGSFRSDLYYRLNVLNLRLPPLRERTEDILPIINSLVNGLKNKMGYQFEVSTEFLNKLNTYHWPGNIRELENVLERYAVLAGEGEPPPFRELATSFPELIENTNNGVNRAHHDFLQQSERSILVDPGTLEEMEKQLITILLDRCGGNRTLLSDMLGISRTTIWKRLQSK